VDVQVTTPSGMSPISQPADVYTFTALPAVTTIKSPAVGPLAGQNTVTVNGSNLTSGTTVNFGSTPGTNVQIVSSKLLTVVAPAATTAGSVDITVTSPGGTSKKVAGDLYAYGAPTISSFTPSSGITGSSVTITGSGFAVGVTVSFGSLKSATVKILSATSLTATVPNGDATASAIKVSDTQGSQSSSSQFTSTMAITSFSPSSGSKSAGTTVLVNGIGFSSDSVVAFNKINAATTFVSSTQVTAVVPSTASTGLITLSSPGSDNPSGTVTSVAKFTVNP
jgi:IPT/TIG domain-containing protein